MIKGVNIPVLTPFKFYPIEIPTGNGVVFQNMDNTPFPNQKWAGVYPACFIQPVARTWYDNSPGIDFQVYLDTSVTSYADLEAEIIDLDGNSIYSLTKDDFFYFDNVVVDLIQVRFYSSNLNSVIDGYYKIKIYENGGDDFYNSEIIEIANTHTNCYPLKYSNFENDFGLIFKNIDNEIWEGKMLIPLRMYKPLASNERESYQDDNGVLITLRSMPIRSYEFESLPVPSWFAEKINLIFSNSILTLNKLSINSENTPDIEIVSESDLMVLTGEVQLNSFSNGYWQHDEIATYTYIYPDITKQIYTSYADTGYNNILMPRICKNPVNDKIIQIYRVGSNHVGTIGTIWMRISNNAGVTWTGVYGYGTATEILTESLVDLRNIAAFYTPTGRLIMIYMRYDISVPVFLDTKYSYSDNDGVSWSSPVVFTAPGTELNKFPAPYSNRCVLDISGNLLFPFHYTEGTSTNIGTKLFLAKSIDNGATWDTDYKLVLNTFTEDYNFAEPVIEDFGDGKFIVICRSSDNNTSGYEVPFICYSSDYGEHWAGTSETLSRTNLDNGDHNSGYLYLEGAGITLGGGTAATNCLPNIINMTINSEIFIVIPFWIRDNSIETYIQKMTVIKFTDFVTNGVNAVKTPLTITLFDGLNTLNGGNGSGIVIGNEILFTTCEQLSVYTAGVSNLYTFFIDNNIMSAIATNYKLI